MSGELAAAALGGGAVRVARFTRCLATGFFLCVFALLCLSPAYATQDKANALIIAGAEAMEREDYVAAAGHLDAARHVIGAKLPNSLDFHRGRALMGAGRYTEALLAFQTARSRWPSSKKYGDDALKFAMATYSLAHTAAPVPTDLAGPDFILGWWCFENSWSAMRFEKDVDGQYYRILDGSYYFRWTLKDTVRSGDTITFREAVGTSVGMDDSTKQVKTWPYSSSYLGKMTIRVLSANSLEIASYITPSTNTKVPHVVKIWHRCR